jgi:hypothetical protein
LNLKCDILVSKFPFKCNLYRYNSAGAEITPLTVDPTLTFDAVVGGCTSYILQLTHSLKPPGVNP